MRVCVRDSNNWQHNEALFKNNELLYDVKHYYMKMNRPVIEITKQLENVYMIIM